MNDNLGRIEMELLYEKYSTALQQRLDSFVDSLKSKLSIFPVNVSYKMRIKRFESFYIKAVNRTQEGQNPLMAVKDLLAVRLICPFIEDVDVLEEYLENSYKIVEIERKGVHFSFREFGYNSTHMEVELPREYWFEEFDEPLCCEIQVRTILQDAWAEVEHELVYKNKFAPHDDQLRHKMAALNANLSLSDIIFQEIRTYQKHLRSQLDMRQSRIQQQIDELLAQDFSPYITQPPYFNESASTESIDALLLEALRAHNSGQYEKTIDIYTRLLEKDLLERVRSVILAHRGMALFSCSLFDEALADFEASDQLADSYRVSYYMGVCLLIKHHYEQSLVAFDKSLKLNEEQAQAYLGRARAYFKLNNFERSLSDCEACLLISPDLKTAINFKELLREAITKQEEA